MLATEQSQSFHEAALELLRRHRSIDLLQNESRAEFPDALWTDLANAGWFRVLTPELHGGLGLGLPELGAIFRAVGHCPVRGPLLDQAVSIPVLLDHASGPLLARAESLLEGKQIAAMVESLAPPYGERHDPLAVSGNRLNGQCTPVPYGEDASLFVVVATADEEPCVLLVDSEKAIAEPLSSLDPCVRYARVTFRDVPLRDHAILAKGSEAAALIKRIHAIKQLMMSAEVAGAVEELTRMSVEYVKVRKQFGRTIGSFQALQHMLAGLVARSHALRNLVDASLMDATADPSRLAQIAVVAKAYAMTVGRYAAEEAMQIHGGIGFTKELPLHLYYRRVLTHQGFLGETDSLLMELGSSILSEGISL